MGGGGGGGEEEPRMVGGGGGDDLGEEEEEHGEGEEDGDGEGDLLPTVGGEVEDEDGEEGDAHAGDDQVHRVEQGLPPHRDVEGDVQVGLVAASVEFNIPVFWLKADDMKNIFSARK